MRVDPGMNAKQLQELKKQGFLPRQNYQIPLDFAQIVGRQLVKMMHFAYLVGDIYLNNFFYFILEIHLALIYQRPL